MVEVGDSGHRKERYGTKGVLNQVGVVNHDCLDSVDGFALVILLTLTEEV